MEILMDTNKGFGSGSLSDEDAAYFLDKLMNYYLDSNRFWRRRVLEALDIEASRRVRGEVACKAHMKHLECCFNGFRRCYDLPGLMVSCGSGCLIRGAQLVGYKLSLISLREMFNLRISMKDPEVDGGDSK
jgi:hypothetical protein